MQTDDGAASGVVTVALAKKERVIDFADDNLSRRARHLGMTFEAQIGVPLDKQFIVNRSMRTVARSAAFPHRLVLENEVPGLFSMTLRARFVEPGKPQPAGRFCDVVSVRIMAINTTHMSLHDRMSEGQPEFGVDADVALETRFRRLARVDYQSLKGRPSARLHMPAPRAVARLAACIEPGCSGIGVHSGMNALGENPADRFVAHRTTLRPDKFGSADGGGDRHHGSLAGTREHQQNRQIDARRRE